MPWNSGGVGPFGRPCDPAVGARARADATAACSAAFSASSVATWRCKAAPAFCMRAFCSRALWSSRGSRLMPAGPDDAAWDGDAYGDAWGWCSLMTERGRDGRRNDETEAGQALETTVRESTLLSMRNERRTNERTNERTNDDGVCFGQHTRERGETCENKHKGKGRTLACAGSGPHLRTAHTGTRSGWPKGEKGAREGKHMHV